MAELLDHGQKVKYKQGDKWLKGIIHGVQTHKNENGVITKVVYLIDTGIVTREKANFGKDHKVPEGIEYTHTLEQHEQIEVDQDFVEAL